MDGHDSENDPLLDAGIENSSAFERVYKSHNDISDFLSTHEYIPLRSTNAGVEDCEYDLNLCPDIDGVTIEWKDIASTTHVFNHLFFPQRGQQSLRKVYPTLKKHEDLSKYTASSRGLLKECVGTLLINDSGWEYVLCLLPTFDNDITYDKSVIRTLTLTWLNGVKSKLRESLIRAIPEGKIRRTIEKNNLNDIGQLFILPGDCVAVLKMFQECLDTVVPPQGFRQVLYSYRFGEKNQDPVYLPIRDCSGVLKVCAHIGVSIEPIDKSESLFWSRTRLEQLTGRHGTLTTASALYECANFQSSLDGRAVDVCGDLRKVSVYPERIQFVQLYADVPHCYPKTRYHPVSAAILFPKGLRGCNEGLFREAVDYISVVQSNFMKFINSVCRLEFVTTLPIGTDRLYGLDLVNLDQLTRLLTHHALFVPFASDQFMKSLQAIGLYVCGQLEMLYKRFKGTSCSEGVWQTYQYELTVEKLLWGHPLMFLSRQHAINLGPGIDFPSRCASDQFGFLRLDNKYASCVDEHCTPPLNIYSQSLCVQRQLQKTFGFWDQIVGSGLVLGRRLVEVLLQDLYDVGLVYDPLETFIASLKLGHHSMRAIGVISKSQLSKRLISVKKCKFPMVFLHLIKIVIDRCDDVEQIVRKGLEELQLAYFPAFRNTDTHRNLCMYWHFSYGVWAIRDILPQNSTEMQGSLICALVLAELEKRNLCYTRSLTGTNESFPWVRACLRKLDELKLGEEETVLVLTFVTCVAFLESGRFVEYKKLRLLNDQLPVPQYQLRDMEIQNKFLVNNMNVFKVWRLHPSIPRQSPKATAETAVQAPQKTKQVPAESVEMNKTSLLDESEYGNNVQKSEVVVRAKLLHLPSNYVGRWTAQELAILNTLHETCAMDTPFLTVYSKYQEECRSAGIPDRSFEAFRKKYRLLST